MLKIEAGSFCLRVPVNYLPESVETYQFTFKVIVRSEHVITYLSCPTNSNVIKEGKEGTFKKVTIEKSGDKDSKLVEELVVYFRTNGMHHPILLMQRSPLNHPDEVACLIFYLSCCVSHTFTDRKEDLRAVTDQKPDDNDKIIMERSCFIFIVDRSSYMVDGHKMDLAKQVLISCLRALPSDSYFEVISYGED